MILKLHPPSLHPPLVKFTIFLMEVWNLEDISSHGNSMVYRWWSNAQVFAINPSYTNICRFLMASTNLGIVSRNLLKWSRDSNWNLETILGDTFNPGTVNEIRGLSPEVRDLVSLCLYHHGWKPTSNWVRLSNLWYRHQVRSYICLIFLLCSTTVNVFKYVNGFTMVGYYQRTLAVINAI